MSATATYPQIKNLMETTRRYGAIILEGAWREHNLTKDQASAIIQASIAGDTSEMIRLIQSVVPGWEPRGEEKPEPKGTKPGKGQDDEKPGGDGQEDDSDRAKAEIMGMLSILNDDARAKVGGLLEQVRGEDRIIEVPVPAALPVFEVKEGDYKKPAVFDQVCNAARVGDVFLGGPKGTGKSRMAVEVANALGRPFLLGLVFNSGTKAATMFETKELDGGKTTFALTAFALALQQPGVILIDEIFAAPAKEVIGLNSVTEQGTRSFSTKGHGTIARHPENIIIATSNIMGRSVSRQYQGQQQPDASTLGRFIPFFVDYDREIELSILTGGGLEEGIARELCDRMNSLRDGIKRCQIGHDVGPRELKAAAKLMTVGFSLDRAFSVAFLETLSDAERAKLAVNYVAE